MELAFDNVGDAYSDEEETALYQGIHVTEGPRTDTVPSLLCHHVPLYLRDAPFVYGLLEKRDQTEICGSRILRSDVAGESEAVITWDFQRKPISKSIGRG